MSSIALSFFSVAARFTSDDRIFFVKEAEKLGLRWQRRFPKKDKMTPLKTPKIHDSNGSIEDDEEILDQPDRSARATAKGETSPALSEAKEEYPLNKTQAAQYSNPSIQIKRYEPTFIKFRYTHSADAHTTEMTECRVQTAKIYDSDDTFHWNTRIVHYDPRSNEYCVKGLEPVTDYILRLSFRAKQGKWTDWTDKTQFTTPLFTGWAVWHYIGFNRAYLFRYSFRMCDVFSRLMILSLVWCVLSGTTTFAILTFEVITVVIYAQHIKKYNFFQFLVA
eukprot:595077_1